MQYKKKNPTHNRRKELLKSRQEEEDTREGGTAKRVRHFAL